MRDRDRSRALRLLPVVVFGLAMIVHGRSTFVRAQQAGTSAPAREDSAAGGTPTEGSPAEGTTAEGTTAEGSPAEGTTADGAAGEGTSETDEATEPSGPSHVTVGLYLHHVPELDLHSSSYLADFYLWFLWRGELDPTETFEITNLVEGWDLMKTPLYVDDDGNPAPEDLPDGRRYQCFHVQGRFGHPFDVHAYPFDEQDIVVEIEDGEYLVDELVYEVDPGSTLLHPTLELPGWEIGTPTPTVIESIYPTNFGDIRNPEGGDHYSQFRYSVRVQRPVLGAFVKTIVPIMVVMLITLVMFFIDPKYFEGRLGLGITSLISAVALQLTAAADLPATGYLVLLDHVYNASYIVIFVALLESVISVGIADRGDVLRAKRLDLVTLVVLTITFFGTVSWLVLTR
ncbi:MAG: hypothetical protein K1X94_09285 [Sandaracinaceae bacterium]|nr:hypothetical protein [Sandaracinaceae bacterium]